MRLHLEITGRCNLNCIYCYNANFNSKRQISDELTLLEWFKIIDEANKLHCERFTISGGEPFLVPKLKEIIKRCKAQVIVFTNALFLTKENLKDFKNIKNLKAFRISLDGLNSHDKYRPSSKGAEIIEKIKLIKNSTKIGVGITTQFNKELTKEIENFYGILKNIGIDNWRIDLPFYSGRYKNSKNNFKQANFKNIIISYRNILKEYFRDNKPFKLNISNVYNSELSDSEYADFQPDRHPCCQTDIISVKPNGNIVVCAAYNLLLANIRQCSGFKKAINKAKNNDFYKIKLGDIRGCENCRYIKLCGSGCRADSFCLTKNNLLPDPVACSLMPFVERYILPVLPKIEREKLEILIDKKGKIPKSFFGIEEIKSFYNIK